MTSHDDQNPTCYACRCYEVTDEQVREAIALGATTMNDIKRRTRAGFGLCQGVYCVPAITAMLAEATGRPVETLAPMTSRPPARLLTLAELESLDRE
jgi:bacterioferritin-associated ferredoxin